MVTISERSLCRTRRRRTESEKCHEWRKPWCRVTWESRLPATAAPHLCLTQEANSSRRCTNSEPSDCQVRRDRRSNVQISSGTKKQLKHLLCTLLHTAREQDLTPQPADIRRIQREVRLNTTSQQNTNHCRRRARQLQLRKRAGQSRLQDPSTTFTQEKRPKASGTDDECVSTVRPGMARKSDTTKNCNCGVSTVCVATSGYLSLFTNEESHHVVDEQNKRHLPLSKGLLELVTACSQRQKPWHLSLHTTGAPTSLSIPPMMPGITCLSRDKGTQNKVYRNQQNQHRTYHCGCRRRARPLPGNHRNHDASTAGLPTSKTNTAGDAS